MFKNYLAVALRNIFKHKSYSLINIVGLAVGMACFIFVFVFIDDQLSYDDFHANRDNIYRVGVARKLGDGGTHFTPSTMAPLAPRLDEEAAGIRQAIRVDQAGKNLVSVSDVKDYEAGMLRVDPAFLEIFSFPVLAGTAAGALNEPYAVVLSKSAALKYYQNIDVVGQILTLNNKDDYTVTAVVEDPPTNSHLQFDFLLSFTAIDASRWQHQWDSLYLRTYLLLDEKTTPNQVEAQMASVLRRFGGPEVADKTTLFLQPLPEVHLHSIGRSGGPIIMVYALGVIGFLIMLVAAINYMNLATARSLQRAKEVGLRKVVGANRIQLVTQFLGESVLFSVLAFPLALGMLEGFIPIFNRFLGDIANVHLRFDILQRPDLLFTLGVIAVLIGLIAGSYPAIFLARQKPVLSLKDGSGPGSAGVRLRKILVVTQFSFSAILIMCTAILSQQVHYLKDRDLGFNKEHVVNIQLEPDEMRAQGPLLKQRLLSHTNILGASLCRTTPVRPYQKQSSGVTPEGYDRDSKWSMQVFPVDHDFIKTFGLDIVQGRDFSMELSTDVDEACLINETAAQKLGWENSVGKHIQISGRQKTATVIGVVKDFHYDRMTNFIQPAVLYIEPREFGALSVRMRGDDVAGTLKFAREQWAQLAPAHPLQYSFLDEETEALFRVFTITNQFFTGFTLLAILIAMLGLLGLAAYTAERRTREIGIRKVLGASVTRILLLMSKDFVKLLVLANLIAWPLVYFLMNFALQSLPYATPLTAWPFIISSILILGLALVTVISQSMKAAFTDPADTLRYE